jgi:hypothetical protein
LSWRSSAESIVGSSSFLLLLDGVAMSWVFLRMWYKASLLDGDVIVVGARYRWRCLDIIN